MSKPWKLFGSGCLTLLLIVLIAAGCEQTSVPSSAPTETTVPIKKAEATLPSPVPTADPTNGPAATPSVGHEHDAQVSSNTPKSEDPASVLSPTGTPKQTTKPKVEEADAYHQEKPTLMGLKLGTPKDKVLRLFGKASNQFVMDEDADAITVYEYPDFSIGFNTKNDLEFVDIHTADIDPGLGGLRLGQNPEEAIRILGKPDTKTKYVLSYKAQGTVLKLDIDPKENTIQSIKLFVNQ